MRIHLLGVRGSTPAPGAAFARYGGHTSCVALSHGDEDPTLLLDVGTGARRLSDLLGDRPFRGHILLGHLHWDHTQGLPFLRAADRDDAEVDLHLPAQGDPLEVLARGMSPPHFPVRPDDLRGTWRFHGIEEGDHRVAGFRVLAREIPHKGGRTFGYRVEDGRGSVTYISDHHPSSFGPGPDGFGEYHEAALDLAGGVDLLIHDAQYTAAEFAERADFGHTTADYAIGLARCAGAGGVLLFHHDPARTDDELEALERALRHEPGDPQVLVAREETAIDVRGTDPRVTVVAEPTEPAPVP